VANSVDCLHEFYCNRVDSKADGATPSKNKVAHDRDATLGTGPRNEGKTRGRDNEDDGDDDGDVMSVYN
jgi:hypothetical protein